jgi:hypothetical protein
MQHSLWVMMCHTFWSSLNLGIRYRPRTNTVKFQHHWWVQWEQACRASLSQNAQSMGRYVSKLNFLACHQWWATTLHYVTWPTKISVVALQTACQHWRTFRRIWDPCSLQFRPKKSRFLQGNLAFVALNQNWETRRSWWEVIHCSGIFCLKEKQQFGWWKIDQFPGIFFCKMPQEWKIRLKPKKWAKN